MAKNDFIHMYINPIQPEKVLPKGVILEALVRSSGDTVCVIRIKLDTIEVWRHGKKKTSVATMREVFVYCSKEGW